MPSVFQFFMYGVMYGLGGDRHPVSLSFGAPVGVCLRTRRYLAAWRRCNPSVAPRTTMSSLGSFFEASFTILQTESMLFMALLALHIGSLIIIIRLGTKNAGRLKTWLPKRRTFHVLRPKEDCPELLSLLSVNCGGSSTLRLVMTRR